MKAAISGLKKRNETIANRRSGLSPDFTARTGFCGGSDSLMFYIYHMIIDFYCEGGILFVSETP
jgi:hypothetical protein